MPIFPHYLLKISSLVFFITTSVFLTLFILGNILILVGILHQSKAMIITGIIFTGVVWGTFLWLKKTGLIKAKIDKKPRNKRKDLH